MNDLELLLNNPLWVWVAAAAFVFGVLFAAILNVPELQKTFIFRVYKEQKRLNKNLKKINKDLRIELNTAKEQIFCLQQKENISNLGESIQEIRERKHEND